jgi:uncharacterized protein YndB with AHSA1/START domain
MASENQVEIAAPPDEVFAVVTDPRTYPDWVVGCDRIRGIDAGWPQPGSRFHHTVGAGPAKVDDSTAVVHVDHERRRLTLAASAGSAGAARVTFHVEPAHGAGATASLVTIEEEPTDGPTTHLPSAVTDTALQVRNAETLRRLRKFVERRS